MFKIVRVECLKPLTAELHIVCLLAWKKHFHGQLLKGTVVLAQRRRHMQRNAILYSKDYFKYNEIKS